MSIKKLLRATANTSTSRLLVTPRYEQYLAQTPNVLVDEKIGEFVKSELTSAQRNRRMTFSASSRGACPREQVFQFTGAKPLPRVDSDLHAIFHQGTFIHLKWQVLLLDAGILDQVEIPCVWDKYNLTGTMDGSGLIPENHPLESASRAYSRFGWELKSINERGFRWVCDRGPNKQHLLQTHAYMMASGLRLWSIVYDNKNDSTWKEFVIPFDEDIAKEVETELMYLNDMVDQKKLPPVLSDCKAKKGPFPRCAFRHVCLDTKDWPERVLKMRRL